MSLAGGSGQILRGCDAVPLLNHREVVVQALAQDPTWIESALLLQHPKSLWLACPQAECDARIKVFIGWLYSAVFHIAGCHTIGDKFPSTHLLTIV